MTKTIIFDFNRTLYDPDRDALFPETLALLAHAKSLGYRLYLISKAGEGRDARIQDLELHTLFHEVHLVQEKNLELFQKLAVGPTLVVGDRIRREITLGNQCGATTIWFRSGKFSTELPTTPIEEPTHAITALAELYRWLS